MLITITLIAIFAAVVVVRWEPTLCDQVRAAAQIVAADVAYARNLAVANNSSYGIRFYPAKNRYVLTHVGSDSVYDTLPRSAYVSPEDSEQQRTTDLAALPGTAGAVSLVVVQRMTPSRESVDDLEFGPLGQSTQSEPTRIWLVAGRGEARHYLAVDVDPITGLATIGETQTESPLELSGASVKVASGESSGAARESL